MDELDRQQNHRRLSGVLREQLNLHRGACGARCEVQALTSPTTDIAIFRGLLYPARPISVIASRSIMSLPTRRRSLDATLFGDMGGSVNTSTYRGIGGHNYYDRCLQVRISASTTGNFR
jgi:hypothetical protein